MIFRKTIFWFHLICGLISAIIVLIMSFTGVALTYQKQMTQWADKKACRVNKSDDAGKISVEGLIKSFQKARPDVYPLNISISSDPEMPAAVAISREEVSYVDPYSGEILGAGSERMRSFFRIMTDWHRWLALSGESRKTGKAITGACNLAFLFLALSGIYLWWPRKWTWKMFRAVAWFRTGLSAKGRDFNWHNVFGLWCLIPLILIIVSAAVISYPWANRLLFRLSGSSISFSAGPSGPSRGGPPSGPSAKTPGSVPGIQQASLQPDGLDKMLDNVMAKAGSWKTISFPVPSSSSREVSFSVDRGWGGQPHLRSTIAVDISTGKIVREEKFEDMDPGFRARMWMRFVHTGEYYGLTGQTIAGVASIGGVILVWTGIALSIRRYILWIRRRSLK